jgi:O-antigen/teichoic acid export membrane protein
VRLLCMVGAWRRLGLTLPMAARPNWRTLKEMARYCAGLSLLKLIGTAIARCTVPFAQIYTTTAMIGSYDAVERIGGVLQRASNPVADSLFQRFVRSFDVTSNELQRELGRRDFLAGTLLVVSVSAVATLGVVNFSRWLFPLWLGTQLAEMPIAFAPYVMTNLSLALGVSMCGALLVARARIRECVWLHALGLVATVATIAGFGTYAQRMGHNSHLVLFAAPFAGTVVVATGLIVLACDSAGVRLRLFFRHVVAVWSPAWLAIAGARLWPTLLATSVSSALGLLGIALVVTHAEPLRSLAREFRRAGTSGRPDPGLSGAAPSHGRQP